MQAIMYVVGVITLSSFALYYFFILKPLWNENSLRKEEEERLEAANRAFEQTQLQGGFHDYYGPSDESYWE